MFHKELTNKTSASKECMIGIIIGTLKMLDCNKCHDVLMTAHELKNIAILNAKGVDFRFCGVLVGVRLLIG